MTGPTPTTAQEPQPQPQPEAAPATAAPTEPDVAPPTLLAGATAQPGVLADRGNGAAVDDAEVQSLTQRMETQRATDEPLRSSPFVDANKLRAVARSSEGAYSPAPDSKYSMGMGMDVQSVQQTESSESASLFSTM